MEMMLFERLLTDGSSTWDAVISDCRGEVEINLLAGNQKVAEWDFFRLHALLEELTGATIPVKQSRVNR